MPRPKNELPQNVPDHMKLMLDLVVLAFQMDKTRVATLMLNNDLSQMNFKFLEGVQGALHLDLTHNGHAADKEAMYLKTNQYHIAQFAYLTQRMKDINEGETTLLDNSILMLTSSLFDGDAHGANQLPILLTGKGGGTLKTGRMLDYLDKGDENRKACSLHLSLMDRMGVKLDKFGDATTRLTELSVVRDPGSGIRCPLTGNYLGPQTGSANTEWHRERATASEPRERSAPAKRRARERVGESEGQSPSERIGSESKSKGELRDAAGRRTGCDRPDRGRIREFRFGRPKLVVLNRLKRPTATSPLTAANLISRCSVMSKLW